MRPQREVINLCLESRGRPWTVGLVLQDEQNFARQRRAKAPYAEKVAGYRRRGAELLALLDGWGLWSGVAAPVWKSDPKILKAVPSSPAMQAVVRF